MSSAVSVDCTEKGESDRLYASRATSSLVQSASGKHPSRTRGVPGVPGRGVVICLRETLIVVERLHVHVDSGCRGSAQRSLPCVDC